MKLIHKLLIFTALTYLVQSQSTDADEEENAWNQWIADNARLGGGSTDFLSVPLNKDVFFINYRIVKLHNYLFELGMETYQMILDSTATLTQEQFIEQNFGLNPQFSPDDLNITESDFDLVVGDQQYANLPPIWDISKHGPGKLLQAKSQRSCGACWAFSSLAAISNVYSVATGLLYSFSEQEQIDCNDKAKGCGGGWFTAVFNYAKNNGLRLLSQYPYTAKVGECIAANFQPTMKLDGYVRLPDDSNAIKYHLKNNGCCAVAVAASNWQLFGGGIFHSVEASPVMNHGVVLAGYGPGYWLLLNSWGPNWGEGGFIRVADNGKGGIFTNQVYCPTCSNTSSNTSSNNSTEQN